MLNQDYTAKLPNLEDVIITNVENISEELHINIELPRKEHTCPVCGSVTDRVHDYADCSPSACCKSVFSISKTVSFFAATKPFT